MMGNSMSSNKIKLLISIVALLILPLFITGFENEESYGDTKFKDNVYFMLNTKMVKLCGHQQQS